MIRKLNIVISLLYHQTPKTQKSTQLNLIILESARHTYQKTVQAKRDGTDTNFLVIDVDSFNISHHVSIISIDSSLHRSQIGCLSLFFESQIHYHPAGD